MLSNKYIKNKTIKIWGATIFPPYWESIDSLLYSFVVLAGMDNQGNYTVVIRDSY
jgi:hypothetical protein